MDTKPKTAAIMATTFIVIGALAMWTGLAANPTFAKQDPPLFGDQQDEYHNFTQDLILLSGYNFASSNPIQTKDEEYIAYSIDNLTEFHTLRCGNETDPFFGASCDVLSIAGRMNYYFSSSNLQENVENLVGDCAANLPNSCEAVFSFILYAPASLLMSLDDTLSQIANVGLPQITSVNVFCDDVLKDNLTKISLQSTFDVACNSDFLGENNQAKGYRAIIASLSES